MSGQTGRVRKIKISQAVAGYFRVIGHKTLINFIPTGNLVIIRARTEFIYRIDRLVNAEFAAECFAPAGPGGKRFIGKISPGAEFRIIAARGPVFIKAHPGFRQIGQPSRVPHHPRFRAVAFVADRAVLIDQAGNAVIVPDRRVPAKTGNR